MSKLIVVLCPLALLALIGWFVQSTTAGSAEKQSVKRRTPDETRPAAAAREPAATGATKLVVLPVAVNSAAGVATAAAQDSETEDDWKREVPAPELERWEQDSQVEFLRSELARGATGAGSVATERAMRAALEQLAEPGITLEKVRCVTALCELVLRTQGGDTASLLQAMLAHDVLRGEKLFSYSDDGTSMTMFTTPPGAALPRAAGEPERQAE